MSEQPTKMKALYAEEYNGPLEIREFPIPTPKFDEILIKLKYSGICHSDLHGWLGDLHPFSQCPIIGGHEGAGEVVKIGEHVKGWNIGDHAGVKLFNYACLNCEFCKKGLDQNCLHLKNVGFNTPGTFQEYIAIPALDAVKIPKGTDLAQAAPINCAGLTAYKTLKVANLEAGNIVALIGAGGGLGSYAIQYAAEMGIRVIAIDHASKAEHCRELGAEWFVDAFNTPNMTEHIVQITDGGPHAVVNYSVSGKAAEEALDYVRTRGIIVMVAFPKEKNISLDVGKLILKAVRIEGSLVGSRADLDDAMHFLSRGKVRVPLEFVRLDQVGDVYRRMQDGQVTSRSVVDFSL